MKQIRFLFLSSFQDNSQLSLSFFVFGVHSQVLEQIRITTTRIGPLGPAVQQVVVPGAERLAREHACARAPQHLLHAAAQHPPLAHSARIQVLLQKQSPAMLAFAVSK